MVEQRRTVTLNSRTGAASACQVQPAFFVFQFRFLPRNIARGICGICIGVQRRNQFGSPNRGGAWLGQVIPAVRSAIGNAYHRTRSSAGHRSRTSHIGRCAARHDNRLGIRTGQRISATGCGDIGCCACATCRIKGSAICGQHHHIVTRSGNVQAACIDLPPFIGQIQRGVSGRDIDRIELIRHIGHGMTTVHVVANLTFSTFKNGLHTSINGQRGIATCMRTNYFGTFQFQSTVNDCFGYACTCAIGINTVVAGW